MESIKVSLVIPVYNGEKYLRECIDSVVAQTCIESMEVIIIDDGSIDDTPDICDEYASQYRNIIVIHQKNGGLVDARKEGVRHAKGRYITFVDADDWIDEDLVEKMLDVAQKYDAEMVVSGLIFEHSDKSIKCEYTLPTGLYEQNDINKFKKKFIYSDKFFSFGTCVCVWGKIFPLDKYRNYQLNVPSEIRMGEDVAVTLPYVSNINAPVYILEDTYYHYRQLESSMVHQQNNPEREKQTRLLYSILDQSMSQSPDLLERVEYYKASMLIGLLKNNIHIAKDRKEKLDNVQKILCNKYYQDGLRKISFNTMGLKYKIFFGAVRLRMAHLIISVLQRLD